MKKKEKEPATKFWPELVKIFFDFVAEKFSGAKPSFDGSSPRDLKMIVTQLENRAVDAGEEWTVSVAQDGLRMFLERAYSISWLRDNFLLYILNRHKDKVFYSFKTNTNGISKAFTREGVSQEFNRRRSQYAEWQARLDADKQNRDKPRT